MDGVVRRTDLREPPTLGACWRRHDVTVFARGDERNAYFSFSKNDGAQFVERWTRIPNGAFSSGLSAAVSEDGLQFHLFGRGMNDNIWRTRSTMST